MQRFTKPSTARSRGFESLPLRRVILSMKYHQAEHNTAHQFNKWAQTYDSNILSYYFFYWLNKSILRFLKPQSGSSLLDVGFGSGILLRQITEADATMMLDGIDISDEMLKKAKRKFMGNPHVKLYLGSATKLPFKTNTFDYVTCVQSFHHHPDSLQSMKEMYRVLKPNGKLLINDTSLDGPIRLFIHKTEQFLYPERESNIFRYTKAQMFELFQKVGLKKITQQYIHYTSLTTIGVK